MSTIISELSPVERYYARFGTMPPCQPWCTDHHDGGEVPTDGYCSTDRLVIGGIETYVTNGTRDDEPEIFVSQLVDSPEMITVAQSAALTERLILLTTYKKDAELAARLRSTSGYVEVLRDSLGVSVSELETLAGPNDGDVATIARHLVALGQIMQVRP